MGEAEAEVVVAVARRVPVAIGGAAVAGGVPPAATPIDPVGARWRVHNKFFPKVINAFILKLKNA